MRFKPMRDFKAFLTLLPLLLILQMVVPLSTRKEFIMIPDSTSPEEHVDYVLRNYVQNFASREIHFVAHKYGAHALIQALHAQFEKFKDRVSAIAVVDGTHTIAAYPEPEFRKWWFLNAAGYIQSDVDDRGKVIYREHAGCNCVKAGTTEYDFTIVDGMSDIFRFFNSRKDRDNTFDKRKDLLPPRDENDPTTAMIVKDEDINSEDSIK
ncbi:hypothetical protein EDD11_004814 [Mortierella claussenii]|nr:hypothetical protein EDD11_004814 [Mortierella claussenii]